MALDRPSTAARSLGTSLIRLDLDRSAMQAAYRVLPPIGGDGNSDPLNKRVGNPKNIGHTQWNTDFAVDGPSTSSKPVFTADSFASSGAKILRPPTITQGRQINQVKFKNGAGSDPSSTGFSCQRSVQT